MDEVHWDERFNQLEKMVKENARTAKQAVQKVNDAHAEIMSALLGLQKNQLRMLGIAALVGGVLFTILANAVGL